MTSRSVKGHLSVLALCAFAFPALAQGKSAEHRPQFSRPVAFDVSKPLRDIAPIQPAFHPHEKPIRILNRDTTQRPDGALQTEAGPLVSATQGIGFAGVGLGDGYNPDAAPPDTNGSVGPNHYVQWVNEAFGIYNKTTGALIYGPAAGNTIWSGFGGGCQTNNDGDPIVLYDKVANRWFMTQFSVSTTPYKQCFAVSTTGDPTGPWARYAYQYTGFPDYGKFGVWGNAYLAGYNMFSGESGSKACAYDAAAMRAGNASATQVCFNVSRQGLLPSDGDTTPPVGAPAYYLDFGTNTIDYWKMTIGNFGTGTGFALTGPTSIPVASFAAACNGGGTCVPQGGGTQKLDSLGDRLMYRLAYRSVATPSAHESLVVNHAVTTGGKGKSASTGIRWYELRVDGSRNLTVFQQGTFAPDADHRWMGSMAMDKNGNIALGYSKSSSSTDPSIFYTGRGAADPVGTMSTETQFKLGGGSQGRGLSRWGDYSSFSVDTDGCTMWYTTEYLKGDGTWNWSTWIGSVKFPGCS